MADQTLQFKITSDSSGAKRDIADLKSAMSNNFADISKVSQGALSGLNNQFSVLARQIPLIGQPLAGVTRELLNFENGSQAVSKAVRAASDDLLTLQKRAEAVAASVATKLGDFADSVKIKFGGKIDTGFLDNFRTLGTDVEKQAAVAAVGLDAKFIPAVERTALKFSQLKRDGEAALSSIAQKVNAGEQELNSLTNAAASAGSGIGGMLNPLTLAIGGILAMATAEITLTAELFKATGVAANYGQEIYQAHLKTDIAVESLTGYYLAAEKAKVPFDQLVLALARVQRSAVEAELGNKKLGQAFKDLGVNTKDALTDSTKFVDDFSQHMGNLKAGGAQIDEAFKLVSRSGANLIPVFDQMKAGVQGLVEEASRLGLSLTEQQAKELYSYNIALTQLKASFKGLELTIGKEFAPVAKEVVQDTTQLIVGSRPLIEPVFQGFIRYLRDTINETKVLVAAIETTPVALGVAALAYAQASAVLVDLGQTAANVGVALVAALAMQPTVAATALNLALNSSQKAIADTAKIASNSYAQIRDEFEKNLASLYQSVPQVPEEGKESATLNPTPKKPKAETAETALDRALRLQEDYGKKIQDEYEKRQSSEKKFYDTRLISLQEFSEAQQKEEQIRFDGLKTIYAAELDLIEHAKIADDLKAAKKADVNAKIEANEKQHAKTLDDIDRNQQEKERAALESHLAKLVEIQTAGDRARIDLIKKLADERVLTYAQAEQQIEAIERMALDARRERLEKDLLLAGANKEQRQKILDDLKALGVERAAFEEGTTTATQESLDKDAELRLANLEAIRKYQEEITRLTREGEAVRLDMMKKAHASQDSIIRETFKQQKEALDDTYNSRKADLEQQVKQLSINDTLAKQNADKIKALNDEIKALNKLHDAQSRQLDDEEKEALFNRHNVFVKADLASRDSNGDVEENATRGQNAVAGLKVSLQELKGIGQDAFSTFAQGLGQIVSNYVLLGETGPAALRKLLAATLAQIAAESAVRAIYWTAQGIVDLFWNPGRAAADFAGAALFASIAGVAAIAGRATAGDLFKTPSAGTSAASTLGSSPTNQSFNYNSQPTSSGIPGVGNNGVGGMVNTLIDEFRQQRAEQARFNQMQMTINARTEQTFSRIQGIPHGQAVQLGLEENPHSAMTAVITAHGEDPTRLPEKILKPMGF